MNRAKPRDQARAFVDWMLLHAGQVEFAAARYGSDGKVAEVIPCRMPVKSSEDFERVYPWLASRNVGGCNIWIRPLAGAHPHPLLMLDDVAPAVAARVAKKYRAARVETRPGNCQVWMPADRPLARAQRQAVLQALARLAGGDPGATSEPRWGRCPGFMGRKPGDAGVWVNLQSLPSSEHDCGGQFDPSPYLQISIGQGASDAPVFSPPTPGGGVRSNRPSNPGDRSAQHFSYSIHALRAGVPRRMVEARVASRALRDGKRLDPAAAAEYAARTVRAAAAILF